MHVYVVDSGVRTSHREFLRRGGVHAGGSGSGGGGGSGEGINFVEDDEEDLELWRSLNVGDGAVNREAYYGDCDGHGTHIAATVAGVDVGVAPSAVIHPVRVLGCDGGGRASDVVAAGIRSSLTQLDRFVHSHRTRGLPVVDIHVKKEK